jgi:hypothetical protein
MRVWIGLDWIHMAQDNNQLQTAVNVLINLWVHSKENV